MATDAGSPPEAALVAVTGGPAKAPAEAASVFVSGGLAGDPPEAVFPGGGSSGEGVEELVSQTGGPPAGPTEVAWAGITGNLGGGPGDMGGEAVAGHNLWGRAMGRARGTRRGQAEAASEASVVGGGPTVGPTSGPREAGSRVSGPSGGPTKAALASGAGGMGGQVRTSGPALGKNGKVTRAASSASNGASVARNDTGMVRAGPKFGAVRKAMALHGTDPKWLRTARSVS
jgi:hypothetical protein